MTYVSLDRRYVSWDRDKGTAAERLSEYGLSIEELDWSALRKLKRVVVLAEAGSGKTEELKEQARTAAAGGRPGFYCTVKDVACGGLAPSLGPERTSFEVWIASGEPGWFFIDAVDEAKLDRLDLSAALRKLAEGLGAHLRRAHIVLAGRITDWEPKFDRAQFAENLPVPPPPSLPEAPSLLTQVLNGEFRRSSRKKDEAGESVHVVLMMPLDEPRVRLFVGASGIGDPDAFVHALEEGDLGFLAKRPRDLDWLVAYWRREGRFGTLAQMIEASLRARLLEANPQHALEDTLDIEGGLKALERIGAALVFARADRVAVEDSGLSLTSSPGALHLAEVLPDRPAEDHRRLLTRAVFDPATFGTVRLHNDNEGTVRAFLAASWLRRQLDAQGNERELLRLLFRDVYGYTPVRPCAQQTAAWLALWNDSVAREIKQREPDLLLRYGDPGSLPISMRAANLSAVIEDMVRVENSDAYLPEESLRRLAAPELAPTVRTLWKKYGRHRGCRHLLLQIIRLGRMTACVDLVQVPLADFDSDQVTLVLAGRALVACGDRSSVAAYAKRICDSVASLPPQVVWEAIDALFPEYFAVRDFLGIIQRMDAQALDQPMGLDHFGPRCAERLKSRAALEPLFDGVRARLGPPVDEDEEADEPPNGHLKLLGELASALMAYVGPTEAPAKVIDVILRIRAAHRYRPQDELSKSLIENLSRTSEQRRIVFWHVARAWAHAKPLGPRELQSVWDMAILGWPSQLKDDDLNWLLQDARRSTATAETRLAIDAAVDIWHRAGRPAEILERIRREANGLPELAQVLTAWLTPRQRSAVEIEHEREMAELKATRETQGREREESWKTFIAQLKADPGQLRTLPPPSPKAPDARLYHLWQLLSSLDGRDLYAIDDLRPLEGVVGPEVTEAFRKALLRFWRHWQPTLESSRPMGQRNLISNFDCIGICAVSLEARQNPNWARYLSSEDATRAAQFATLELNGFPAWMAPLASAWPKDVGEVLVREVIAEITDTSATPHAGPLQDLESGPLEACRAVAEPLLAFLQGPIVLRERSLSQALTILNRGLAQTAGSFLTLILKRALAKKEPDLAASYLAAAFYRDPVAALKVLRRRVARSRGAARRALVESLLPRLHGDLFRGRDYEQPDLPLSVLEALVVIAFKIVRLKDDVNRPSGVVYRSTGREEAERARDGLFRRLTKIPGAATIRSLKRLARSGVIQVPKEHFEALCRERAQMDSDSDPWTPRGPYEFEQNATAAEQPRTSAQLQSVARTRLEDLTHELRHGDFTRWTQLKSCIDENAVQRFIGYELRDRGGRAYTLEREAHVADDNEPDVRLQARAADARLPIEIKDTASGWSVKALEEGLVDQLCGRYMRDARDRHGIYLIVHRRPRTWRSARGRVLDFPALLRYLRAKADRIASKGSAAPHVQVLSIDISDLGNATSRRPKKKRSAKSSQGHPGTPNRSATLRRKGRGPLRPQSKS